MSEDKLKPRIDFARPLEASREPLLRPAQAFDADAQQAFLAVDNDADDVVEEGAGERAVEQALRPRRSLWRRLVGAGAALFAASVAAQSVQWAYDAWLARDWFALGSGAAGGLIVIAAVGALTSEWCRLYKLRARAETRETGRELLHSHSVGRGRAFCEKLAQQAGLDQAHPALQRWHAALHESQNDGETVRLYAQLVQPVQDRQARREIGRHAAESTLMWIWRLSPGAIYDWLTASRLSMALSWATSAVCGCFAWSC